MPSPANRPDPGIELGSPALQGDSLPTELSGKLVLVSGVQQIHSVIHRHNIHSFTDSFLSQNTE